MPMQSVQDVGALPVFGVRCVQAPSPFLRPSSFGVDQKGPTFLV